MKKLFVLSAAALLALPALATEDGAAGPNSAEATADVRGPSDVLNFSGGVEAPTCEVKNKSQQISLDKIATENVDGTHGTKEFSIQLTKCTPYLNKSVSVILEPQEDSVTTFGGEKILINTAVEGQAATNVGLKVLSGTMNALTGEALAPYGELNTGDISFDLKVVYAKTSDEDIQPGLVSASLPFTVIYK